MYFVRAEAQKIPLGSFFTTSFKVSRVIPPVYITLKFLYGPVQEWERSMLESLPEKAGNNL
jgi:hypothetical protein